MNVVYMKHVETNEVIEVPANDTQTQTQLFIAGYRQVEGPSD